jgi:hypothetical protein
MLAMNYVGYVAGGWGVAIALVGLYTVNVMRRGRALSKRVPAEERRWS